MDTTCNDNMLPLNDSGSAGAKHETSAQMCTRMVKDHFDAQPFRLFELTPFQPPEGALFAEFYSEETKLPLDPRRRMPSLLLHNLTAQCHNENVLEHIHNNRSKKQALYGTSGAGKTRSIFEYLSRHFGLYFVASTKNDPGSSDLEHLIRKFDRSRGHRKVVGHSKNQKHYQNLSKQISIVS